MPRVVGTNEWLSKVTADDAVLLDAIAVCPRLQSSAMRAFRLTRRGRPTEVAAAVPTGMEHLPWKPAVLVGEGLKLGGRGALGDAGLPVFKGLNVFAGGLKGQPMGRWDGDPRRLSAQKIYLYRSLFVPGALFAARKIAQLPTIHKVAGDEVFQNSTIVIQLDRPLPLEKWTISRPIQWFAAKTMRAGVIEDGGGTWMGREYLRLPVPASATDKQLDAIEATGTALIAADEDLADAKRHIRAAVDAVASSPLRTLIVDGDPRTLGLELGGEEQGGASIGNVREDGEALVSDDPAFSLRVPNPALRDYLQHVLADMALEDGEAEVDRDVILRLKVPDDLTEVTAAIRRWRGGNRQETFNAAHRSLDVACGEVLGLDEPAVDQIIEQMTEDPFLSQLRPMYAHRGFRHQPYSDRTGRNMYG